jgi:PadR family transcriptional regulator, regulatory protein AphA
MLSLRPMSGYDIRKAVQASVRHFWSESYGQIYPSLKRLEVAKLVERVRGAQTGRPGRLVYQITASGRAEFRKWLAVAPTVSPVRNEFLLKLFFGRMVGRDECLEHVKQFSRRQEELMKGYRQVEKRLRAEHADDPNLPFWLMSLSYGIHQARGLLNWSVEALAEIEEADKKTSNRKKK